MNSSQLGRLVLGLMAAILGAGSSLLAEPAPNSSTSPTSKEQQFDPAKPRLDRFGDPLPDGALARYGTVRFRQGFLVNAIRYSPDEKSMAIAACGRPLGLWDVASGKELFQFESGENNQPAAIAFSPNGKILVEGGHRDVRLWDTQTGKLIRALKGHTASVRAVTFSPDGGTIISGGHDHSIRFWDALTGQESAKLDKHTESVLALAVSKDGKFFASAGSDNVIRVWLAETRELLKELRENEKYISTLSFSPDAKQLASASDGQTCTIWNVTTGEAVHKIGEGLKSMRLVAFSPNGKWLATGCNDGTIRLWDPATGKEVRRLQTGSFAVSGIAFTRDGKTIASNSAWECGVRFWDVETGKEKRPTDVHQSLIDEIRLSADGKSLLSLGRERRIIRWNPTTNMPVEAIDNPSETLSRPRATLSPSDDVLAWGSKSDKKIHLMDLRTRKPVCEPLTIVGDAIQMRFSPDGKVLAVGCDKGLFYLWKWQTDRNPKPIQTPEKEFVHPYIFTPDSKHLASGSNDGGNTPMHVWDVPTGKKIFSVPSNGYLNALAISPNGKWGVLTSYARSALGRNIKVFDIEKREVAREIKVDPEGGSALAFSPDGNFLAFGGDEKPQSVVKLIEFSTGETIATWKGHHSGVMTLLFSADGRTLFSAGADSTILKWDATGRGGKGSSTPNLQKAWAALSQEASKACPARWDLMDSRIETVAFLRKEIQPARKLDAKEIQPYLDGLNADSFRDREKAAAMLKSLGYSAEPHLRKTVETEKRAEVKQRIQNILDELNGPSLRRIQRAFQVLKTIDNDDAKKLLRELAEGVPDSTLTNEARR